VAGSRSKRLWIIDPSVMRPEEQGVAAVAREWAGEVRVFRSALSPGDGPGRDSGYATDGVVLMGSAASVYDRLNWLGELEAWVRPIVRGEVELPLLGICFGHQLIAHCAGAAVGFVHEERTKLVGVEESRITGSRLLPDRDALRVVVSHREEVKACPDGFDVVARRGRIAVDGIEHRERPVFSFQFHPEAGAEFASHAGIDAALLDERQRSDSYRLLDAFRRHAAHGS